MEIEYRLGKKNLADGLFWRPDYIDAANNKEEKTLHTMGYVTWGFIKHGEAQKVIKNARQATQQSEITNEVDILESHLTDNESLPYDTVNDYAEISLLEKSDMPNNNPIKIKKTSSKCKRKKSTKQAKRVLPKGRKKKKLDKTLLDSQSIKLCFMTCNDKIAHIDCKAAKKISEKESIFAFPLLKMRQILQTLQEADHFLQIMKPRALKAGPLDL